MGDQKGNPLYHQQRDRQYGIRTAGGDRALCRRRTKGNSLPGGGWKHYDEPSGAADDRYESSSDQAVSDQQSGVSQYSPDTGESVS